jgi:uncharacterized paraquat-inducible protein A
VERILRGIGFVKFTKKGKGDKTMERQKCPKCQSTVKRKCHPVHGAKVVICPGCKAEFRVKWQWSLGQEVMTANGKLFQKK